MGSAGRMGYVRHIKAFYLGIPQDKGRARGLYRLRGVDDNIFKRDNDFVSTGGQTRSTTWSMGVMFTSAMVLIGSTRGAILFPATKITLRGQLNHLISAKVVKLRIHSRCE